MDGQAQDQNSGQQDGAAGVEGAQGQEQSGIEKRIGELTAKFRGMERVVAEKDQAIANLTTLLAQQATQGQAAAEPVLPEGMDKLEAERIQAAVHPLVKSLEKTVQRLEQQLAGQVQAIQVQSLTAAMPPEFRQRVEQRVAYWRQNGIPASVEDAITFERGAFELAKDRERSTAGGARQQFNAGYSPLTSGAGASGAARQQGPDAPVPPDIGRWPIDKQVEFWGKRAEGKPF